MPKYRLILQYAGGNYAGWQIQKDRETVQGRLRDAIERVTGSQVSLIAAGRTDAGVHASAQCAHFRLPERHPPERLRRALNGVLPWDIRVQRAREVAESFHARRDALKKRYLYRLYHGPVLPPFLHGWVCHCYERLDVERMQEAASFFRGTWNLDGFAAASTSVKTRTRTIHRSALTRKGRHLRYTIEASGYLQYMVRNIVGTLLEIGRGRMPAEEVFYILASRDRRNAGPTAQPHGLYLTKIWYSKR